MREGKEETERDINDKKKLHLKLEERKKRRERNEERSPMSHKHQYVVRRISKP